MPLITIPQSGADLVAMGHETVTVDNTGGGKGFTASVITPTSGRPAQRAFLTLETASIRFTYDGTAPTTTVGHLMNAGDVLVIEGIANVSAFRAIRTGSTSGALVCTYERFK